MLRPSPEADAALAPAIPPPAAAAAAAIPTSAAAAYPERGQPLPLRVEHSRLPFSKAGVMVVAGSVEAPPVRRGLAREAAAAAPCRSPLDHAPAHSSEEAGRGYYILEED